MKIVLAADHAGYRLKNHLAAHLQELGHEILDLGTNDSASVDYPNYGQAAAHAVIEGKAQRGIVCCGTGIGISLSANKVPGIRCACVSDVFSAKMSRQHNDCQMLALGERVVGYGLATEIATAFIEGVFAGERHQRRVDLIEPGAAARPCL